MLIVATGHPFIAWLEGRRSSHVLSLQSCLTGLAFPPPCDACSRSQGALAHPELLERPGLLPSNSSHSLGRRWDITAFIPVLLWLQNTIMQTENGPGQDFSPRLGILLVWKKLYQNRLVSQPAKVVCTRMAEFPPGTGVSAFLVSLDHTGRRRVVLGHTLNTQSLMKTDAQKKGFK